MASSSHFCEKTSIMYTAQWDRYASCSMGRTLPSRQCKHRAPRRSEPPGTGGAGIDERTGIWSSVRHSIGVPWRGTTAPQSKIPLPNPAGALHPGSWVK